MPFENLIVEVADRLATLTVNRPAARNALDRATLAELKAAFEALATRSDVGVVLLTGSGDKAFVAGADIAAMRSLSPVEAREFARLGQDVLALVESLPQPVIAVVNGVALGGGCELALACDLVVAAEEARFGLPEVSLGVIPGFGGTQRLPRLAGRNLAKELILTGEPISAHRAGEIGLVNRVVPRTQLLETARQLAATILSRSPVALGLAKSAVNRGLDLDLTSAIAFEADAFSAAFASADQKEGMTAFLEKRKPSFQGR